MTDEEAYRLLMQVIEGEDKAVGNATASLVLDCYSRQLAERAARYMIDHGEKPQPFGITITPKIAITPELNIELTQAERPKRKTLSRVVEHDARGRIVSIEQEEVD
jgi:hypothetical protein